MSNPFGMKKVKGLNETYEVEGRHVRLTNGLFWIPKPNKKVKEYMDTRFEAVKDDRHWDSKKPLVVQAKV